MDALAAIIAAAIGAVLAWGTKTYRERRARQLESQNEALRAQGDAHELAAKLYRSHADGGSARVIELRPGGKYDRLESD